MCSQLAQVNRYLTDTLVSFRPYKYVPIFHFDPIPIEQRKDKQITVIYNLQMSKLILIYRRTMCKGSENLFHLKGMWYVDN